MPRDPLELDRPQLVTSLDDPLRVVVPDTHPLAGEAAIALAIGLASGWIITWIFQDAFLVRLP